MGCCFKKPKYDDMGECFDIRQKRYNDVINYLYLKNMKSSYGVLHDVELDDNNYRFQPSGL